MGSVLAWRFVSGWFDNGKIMRTLNMAELSAVAGGESGSGDEIVLPTVTITYSRETGGTSYSWADNGSAWTINYNQGGISVTDAAALGGLMGGALGLGSVVTGGAGAIAAGDLVAAATVVGGVVGASAAAIGIAGVYLYSKFK